MAEKNKPKLDDTSEPIAFQAEIKQLLNILVHSLYTRREIFLRELLSNASDALTQMRFIQQTDRDIQDPSLDLQIRIEIDPDQKLLKIIDTGIGMTAGELKTNLGTIAQSGARAFLEAAEGENPNLADVIGRFGVGFYSVFMVAEWVKVSSRSFQPTEKAASWTAAGEDTFQIGSSDKEGRGTEIEIKLKPDASEFANPERIRSIIKTHSDYLPFPIYLDADSEQVNRQTAIWRENPRSLEEDQYQDFYRQLTLEVDPPLDKIHFIAEAPLMIYALLFLPARFDRGLFTLREHDGLKLFSRKVLIEEYSQELLPPYLRFIQGVVDAEDLPLNVSRESYQATSLMARIKKILSNQVIQRLKELAAREPDLYVRFWDEFGQLIKEGVATDDDHREELSNLLRFRSTTNPDHWSSLEDYLERMKPGQNGIYYILGDDRNSVSRSPHLDYFQSHCYEVLTLTDPVDSFLVLSLREYKELPLQNVADSDLELPVPAEEGAESERPASDQPETGIEDLVARFKNVLGDRVSDVRATERLTHSIARLVDAKGSLGQEVQRVYRMMDQEFQHPKKILELNSRHSLLRKLEALAEDDPLSRLVIEQIYENTLLIEGLHPDPAGMIPRLEELLGSALGRS